MTAQSARRLDSWPDTIALPMLRLIIEQLRFIRDCLAGDRWQDEAATELRAALASVENAIYKLEARP